MHNIKEVEDVLLNEHHIYCSSPWFDILISPDGNVSFCCNMKGSIGNLNTQSFEEVWNGETAQQIRLSVYNNKLHNLCGSPSCPVRNEVGKEKYNPIDKKIDFIEVQKLI
jgi:radical SAM protein with 4Fe4S-binding SPASM domain